MQPWRERWITVRNRCLGSARFQRFAADFPLTRPIARARARGLFDIVAGFVYSQVAFACVEVKLLDKLADGPLPADAIAGQTNLPIDRALVLLKAAASLGLVEALGNGRYALGAAGAALLGNPGVAEMIVHHRHLYGDLADPVALLRGPRGGGALAGYWPYDAADSARVAQYSTLMAASQPMLAGQIIDAYPFARHRRLLDIAGGEGVFVETIAARVPGLALELLDLAAVAERAAARLGARATVHGGSFISEALPTGADIITLVRVAHDHDDDVVMALLRKVRGALPPGGVCLIAEPMAGTPGAEPIGAAYFGFYLLAMGSGRPRTADELTAMLRAAGFASVRRVATRTPLIVQVLAATV